MICKYGFPFYCLLVYLLTAAPAGSDEVIDGLRFDPGDTSCAGFPRLWIESMHGSCVGLVVSARDQDSAGRGMIMPRSILQIPGSEYFIVVDMGGWTPGKGRVWRLDPKAADSKLDLLIDGLKLPHGLRLGPDGKVYVGEMHRIFRFDPVHPDDQEVVIDGLPGIKDGPGGTHMHPITQFIFDSQWNLYVNVGAPSDHCKRAAGRLCSETSDGAQLRRYVYVPAGNRWDSDYSVRARGLRNTMAMAVHASGTFLQADNGRDFAELERPYEEINVVRGGFHYGWPYCYDFSAISPEWQGVASCAQGAEIIEGETGFYDTPYILLPPHSAPLDMLYYRGAAFPQLNGQLIVSLHGYRETGHRIIAFAVDDKGLPQLLPADQTAVYYADNPQSGTAALEKPYQPDGALLRSAQHSEIVSGWYESAGYRPLGSPLGLLVDAAGLLWVVEDKPQSKAILVIAPADAVPLTAAPRPQNQAYVAAQTLALRFDPQNWQRYQKVYDEVLMTSCAGCHGFDPASPEATPLKTFARLLETPGWIKPGLSGQSVMLQRIAGNNTAVMPPSSSGNPPVAAELLSGVLQPWIDAMPGSLAQSPVKIATTAVSIRSAAAPAAEKCGTLAVGDLIYVTGETTGADYHWYEYKLPDNSTLAVSCRNRSSYFSVQRKIGDKTYITDLTD